MKIGFSLVPNFAKTVKNDKFNTTYNSFGSLKQSQDTYLFTRENKENTTDLSLLKLKMMAKNQDKYTSEDILKASGIKVKKNNKGLLIINKYKQPSEKLRYSDIGIDEDKLLKDIIEIRGNADFSFSRATNMGNVRKIGGSAYFTCSTIKDLGKLKSIGKNADFHCSHIESLGKLEYIGGDADFSFSPIPNLGKLKYIGGYINFRNSAMSNLQKYSEYKWTGKLYQWAKAHQASEKIS